MRDGRIKTEILVFGTNVSVGQERRLGQAVQSRGKGIRMKIVIKQGNYRGSVLLVSLLTAWIIGIALVSYLTLVANQNRRTFHSQTWNTCVPVVEAGIEEALTQIHSAGVANLGANQWAYNATDGQYHKTRTVGNEGGYFECGIQPVDPPVIVCTGYAVGPGNTGTPMGGNTAFGMILGTVSAPSAPRYISRTVRVTTIKQGSGMGGLNAKGHIVFSGGGNFDSFDSSDPNASTNGKYDPAKRKANAIAMTNLGGGGAISMGNGTIFGSVTTGNDGHVAIGGGVVGDTAWNASNNGIQPGHERHDANLEFDDVAEPFLYGSGMTPVSGVNLLNGVLTTNSWVLGSGNYQLGSVTVSGGRTMLVTGDATLYVNGNFSTSGSGGVYIAPGASLKLYIAGTGSFSGNGIVNLGGLAKNLSIYGLNTSRSITYSGISAFIGTVYAPHADFKFSGSAGAFGTFTGETINVSGGAHIAYDEDLSDLGDYVIKSWNEI